MSAEFDALKTKFVAFASEVTVVLADKDAQIAALKAQVATPVTVLDPTPAEVTAVSAEIDAAIAALPVSTTGGPIHPNLV